MLTLYCYPKCTTCRRAIEWLGAHKVSYNLRDIKEDRPSEDILRDAIEKSGLPARKFFNTSGMCYRELELAKKLPKMSGEEQIRLLASDGMLVKRPLAIGEDFALAGFRESEWENSCYE